MKPQFKFKYNKNKYSSGIYKICTGREDAHSDLKGYLLRKWEETYKKYYIPYNQYGKHPEGESEGVLTSKGTWSSVNQINTHATAQDILIQYLNQQISNKFFTRGIEEVGGRPVKLIEFDPKSLDKDYLRSEIDNYFFWIHYFGDKIFKNLNNITSDDPLYHVLEIANFTMAQGTFGELATEYMFKTKLKEVYETYRNSSVRGDDDDMKNGIDIYVKVRKTPDKIKKFQVKNTTMYSGNTIYTSINTKNYNRKGVDYLVLAQMDLRDEITQIPNPKTLVFLPMKPDLLKTNRAFNGKDTYTFNKEDIIMEEQISSIFKSRTFFEFFKYCSKQGIKFNMDVSDEEPRYEILEKSVHFFLPAKQEKYNESIVLEAWEKLINEFEEGESKKESLKFLQQFIK